MTLKATRWGGASPPATSIHDDKRRRILREAGMVFGEVGFHNASMDLIAARLGLTKAALYYYFADKSEILMKCFELGFEVAGQALADALAAPGSGLDRVSHFVHRYVQGMSAELGACGAGVELRSAPVDQLPGLLKRMRSFDRRLRELIQAGIADGSIGATDAALAVNWIMGAMAMLPRWYRPSSRLSADEVGRSYAGYARQMLAAPPAS